MYNVIIIGSGPGGYIAAVRAAQLGLKVLLVEASELGGVCLNRGCIPTKVLAHSAGLLAKFRDASKFGIGFKSPSPFKERVRGEVAPSPFVNFKRLIERKNNIVAGLRKGIEQLLKTNHVEYLRGTARVVAPDCVEVDGRKLSAKNIIVATGSAWRELPNFIPDGKAIITSDRLLDMEELPERITIVGAGAVGVEFASILNILGVDVTLVEIKDRILPAEDPFISRGLHSLLKRRGVKIETGSPSPFKEREGVRSPGGSVMVAVGRRPNTECLEIECTKTEGGFIKVDDRMRISPSPFKERAGGEVAPSPFKERAGVRSPSPLAGGPARLGSRGSARVAGGGEGCIYAIGDVVGPPLLAHKASEEGIVAAEDIAGLNSRMDYSVIPRPIFTEPEAASVGKVSEELEKEGVEFTVGRYSFAALPKAIADGEEEGMLIAYVGKDERILGAHSIGAHSTEIIAEIALAMRWGIKASQVVGTIHAHPTYSEIVKEAVGNALGKAIHKAGGKRKEA